MITSACTSVGPGSHRTLLRARKGKIPPAGGQGQGGHAETPAGNGQETQLFPWILLTHHKRDRTGLMGGQSSNSNTTSDIKGPRLWSPKPCKCLSILDGHLRLGEREDTSLTEGGRLIAL